MADSDVSSLAETVTKKQVTVKTTGEAILAIVMYSETAVSLLTRKKVTKEILYRYLHNNKVDVPITSDKSSLIEYIREYWLTKERTPKPKASATKPVKTKSSGASASGSQSSPKLPSGRKKKSETDTASTSSSSQHGQTSSQHGQTSSQHAESRFPSTNSIFQPGNQQHMAIRVAIRVDWLTKERTPKPKASATKPVKTKSSGASASGSQSSPKLPSGRKKKSETDTASTSSSSQHGQTSSQHGQTSSQHAESRFPSTNSIFQPGNQQHMAPVSSPPINHFHDRASHGDVVTNNQHVSNTTNVYNVFTQINVSQPASPPIQPSIAPAAPASENQVLGETFAKWFYDNLNSHNPVLQKTPEDFGPHHFWDDSYFTLISQTHEVSREHYAGPSLVSGRFLSFAKSENLLFNPNISRDGVFVKSDAHGLVMILVCGTIHQNNDCPGTFLQAFGIVKDPRFHNNFKIKKTVMKVTTAQVSALPALEGNPESQIQALLSP